MRLVLRWWSSALSHSTPRPKVGSEARNGQEGSRSLAQIASSLNVKVLRRLLSRAVLLLALTAPSPVLLLLLTPFQKPERLVREFLRVPKYRYTVIYTQNPILIIKVPNHWLCCICYALASRLLGCLEFGFGLWHPTL